MNLKNHADNFPEKRVAFLKISTKYLYMCNETGTFTRFSEWHFIKMIF